MNDRVFCNVVMKDSIDMIDAHIYVEYIFTGIFIAI